MDSTLEKKLFSIIGSRTHNIEEVSKDHLGSVTGKVLIVQMGHQRPGRGKLSTRDQKGSQWSEQGTVRAALCDGPGSEVQPSRHRAVCLHVYVIVMVRT